MSRYVTPAVHVTPFTCPLCGVYAQQHWSVDVGHRSYNGANWELVPISRCLCIACSGKTFWSNDSRSLILPRAVSAPMPHPDLPANCLPDFEEARNVFSDSPRASAALLRLCVQKLMVDLGQEGKNIDADIAALVKNGLPDLVKKALDICRVTGNHAVHPGELSSSDTADLTAQIFSLINFIVTQTIERQKSIAAMYEKLPEGARLAIDKRDARSASTGMQEEKKS